MKLVSILIGAALGAAAGTGNYLRTRRWMKRSESIRGAELLFLCHLVVTAAALGLTWGACRLLGEVPLVPFAVQVLVQTVLLILCVLGASRARRQKDKEA